MCILASEPASYVLKLFLQTSKCISKFIFNEKETSPNLILKNTTKLKHIFYMTTVSDLNTNCIYIKLYFIYYFLIKMFMYMMQ